MKDLFKLSKRHDVAHLVGNALEKNGLLPDDSQVKTQFLKERNMALFRYEQIRYELDRICNALDKAQIQYITLKGSVIRKYYPEPWMRTSCDIDILVHEEDLQKTIEILQNTLDYRYEMTGNHDVSLYAESGVHLELHYRLDPNENSWAKVLLDVWASVKSLDQPRCELKEEMFFFYHVAHMAGHFKAGGCGVRSFLDLYLLRKNLVFDFDKLTALLKEGGLDKFYNSVCAVADCWFGEGESTPIVRSIEDYIINSGMYGDMRNRVAIQQKEKGGNVKFLLSRIFLPYSQLKFVYPKLQKYPILFPFYQVKRWFKLLKKDSRKKSVSELKETISGDNEKKKRVTKLLKDLEL